MRNLKRALSLALASVMLLGMMVVGTSAASYPDVDENDNVEAIEVLNAVKVMIGRQGNFEPDEAVNRHEMAVIMAKLVLGNETADNYVGTHPFTDVVSWADKYVAACYENGLVAGTSATTFSGSKNLTAVEAAAMMLRALGYKDLSKGATDWRAPVTAMANQIRLFSGVASNPSQQLNRNQVAQLALNTLKSPVVDLKDNTFDVTSGDGAVIISGGAREYIVRSSREAYAYAINDTESAGTSASSVSGATIELGEHLYNGKLRLNNSDLDVFGRPARTWEYDGKEIGTYMKEELLRKEWTDKVTGKDLYDLLTKNTIDTYDFVITVDGVERNDANAKTMLAKASTGMANAWFDEDDMFRANDNAVGGTGKGVLTQAYVDSNNKMVYISVVNTYLAKAAENYDEKDEDVILNVHKLDDKGPSSRPVYVKTNTNTPEPITVSNEDFDVTGVKKDDFFLVTVADGAIQSMVKPEVIDKTVISSFSLGSWVNNGTKYEYATTAKYDHEVLDDYDVKNMKNLTYNIFLDKYGYLIGLERNEDPDEYVFLTGINTGWSNIAVKTAEANVIHMDGRLASVDVNMSDSYIPSAGASRTRNLSQINTWCKYTVDTNGVYTLTEVKTSTTQNETKVAVNPVKVAQYAQDVATYKDAGAATKTISQRYWSLNAADGSSYVYGNENSVYINVSLKSVHVQDNTVSQDCRIINEVDAVVTDVAKANVVVRDLGASYPETDGTNYTNPTAEIYTLYNDKNIVIAAVTIGEDDGSNVRYVSPVKDTLEEEDYGHGSGARAVDGKWTWHRKVVTLDGTVETITETGDKLKYIGAYDANDGSGMQKGLWYEIRLNADGDVRSRTAVNFATANDKFANSLEDANDQAPKYDTVIMYDSGLTMTGLKLEKNGMLYAERSGSVDQDTRRGIYIDEDTKVVLVTADDSKTMADQWTGTGRTGLEQALSKMNAESGSFGGGTVELSAVIKMGKTTVVVINDKNLVTASTNPNPKPSQGIAGVKVAIKGADRTAADLEIGYLGAVPSVEQARDAVKDFLYNEMNYSTVNERFVGNTYYYQCYVGSLAEREFEITMNTTDIKNGVRYIVDGNMEIGALDTDTNADSANDAYAYTVADSTYVSYDKKDAAGVQVSAKGSSTSTKVNITGHDWVITTGYTGKVTIDDVVYPITLNTTAIKDLKTGAGTGALLDPTGAKTYTAYSTVLATDDQTYKTGYIKLTNNGGENITDIGADRTGLTISGSNGTTWLEAGKAVTAKVATGGTPLRILSVAADGTKRIVTDNVTPPSAAGDGQKELPIPASTTDLEITKLTAVNLTITGATDVEISVAFKSSTYTASQTGLIAAAGDKANVTVTLKSGLALSSNKITMAPPSGGKVTIVNVPGTINGGWDPSAGELTLVDGTLTEDVVLTFTIEEGTTPGALSVVFGT